MLGSVVTDRFGSWLVSDGFGSGSLSGGLESRLMSEGLGSALASVRMVRDSSSALMFCHFFVGLCLKHHPCLLYHQDVRQYHGC